MNRRVAKALRQQSSVLVSNKNNSYVQQVTKKKKKVRRGGKKYEEIVNSITRRRAEGTFGYIYKDLKRRWNDIPRNERSIKRIPLMGM